MCTEVIVEGSHCETIGQLEKAVGGELVIESPNRGHFGPECCLCVVDIDATAAKHGFSVARSNDPFVYGELHRT